MSSSRVMTMTTRLPRCAFCAARAVRVTAPSSRMLSSVTRIKRRSVSTASFEWPHSIARANQPSLARHVSSSSASAASAAAEPLYPARLPTAPPDEGDTAAVPDSPSLQLTERATAYLARLCKREGNERLALRLAVEPGGCHGYQYSMAVTDMEDAEEGIEEDDYLFTSRPPASAPEAEPWAAHVLVDRTSLSLLSGSTLDYATELIGSQFVVRDNPNAKGAGCGCGVSWEPKDGVGMGTSTASPPGPGEIDIGVKGASQRVSSVTA